MHEVVGAAGLRVPVQKTLTTFGEARAWLDTGEIAYPVVVKPLASGGTDGVSLCHDDAELKQGIATILSSITIFSEQNTTFQMQEYIDGDEFVVDTVSYNGRHYVTDFARYVKSKRSVNAFIYDEALLLSSEGDLQDAS